MSRTLTTAVIAQLEAQHAYPALLVELQFANETIYTWSGVGTIAWNGQNWLGVGNLGSVSTVQESNDVTANGISLTLSGVPTQLLGDALNQVSTSKQAFVYLAFLDSTGAVVASPILCFQGLMDQPQIDIGGETSTISIAVENRMSDLNRARGGRYTDQDQRARHSTDSGLKFVAQLQDEFFDWK